MQRRNNNNFHCFIQTYMRYLMALFLTLCSIYSLATFVALLIHKPIYPLKINNEQPMPIYLETMPTDITSIKQPVIQPIQPIQPIQQATKSEKASTPKSLDLLKADLIKLKVEDKNPQLIQVNTIKKHQNKVISSSKTATTKKMTKNISKETLLKETVSQNIKPSKRIKPNYPETARQRQIEGEVILSFDIDQQGQAININLVKATPPITFNQAAIQALKQSNFPITKHNGQAIIVTNQKQVYQFKLD